VKVERILEKRRVLVAVTGSIAIYKTLQFIRYLVKSGAEVRVIMSESAKKFITPLTFETISGNRVLDDSTEDWSSDMNHIAIGKWAESFVIAPATANTINKLANGIADNILLQTALAYGREIIISPSANTNMIHNPITEGSLKLLNLSNFKILGTQVKELACRTDGDGAMAEPEEIYYAVARDLLKKEFWKNRRVVVTGGGTVEKIDEVRYISNFSSGKMAHSMAMALYFMGADVCFISSKFPETIPSEMCKIDVESADEMNHYLTDSLRIAKKGITVKPKLGESGDIKQVLKRPYLFMASAVADYKPKFAQSGKVKSHLIGREWSLELTENIDILENIPKDGIVAIGFKAEMDESKGFQYASNMIQKKNLDGVCLNILNDSSSFGTEHNQIDLIGRDGTVDKFERMDKNLLALKVVESCERFDS
jgi:phosphopantothenoylcysteine decarboxylase/phosphopantothenate--cysteine ligase